MRGILDRGGLREVTIFASGSVDEYLLMEYAQHQVPIDGYGIGTHLDTSSDAPYLDCAYKLEEYAGRPRRKRSEGKATWPGRKQVCRRYDTDGVMLSDTISTVDETHEGRPLLHPVMHDGLRLNAPLSLSEIREFTARELTTLPKALRELQQEASYPVTISEPLRRLAESLDAQQQ